MLLLWNSRKCHLFLLTCLLQQLCWPIANASPPARPTAITKVACSRFNVRKEWRTLTVNDQKSYIEAVKCLLNSAPIVNSTTPAATSRYEDFLGVHIDKIFSIHYVGIFYPWHRRMLALFETALQDECRYTGSLPYWDWSQDLGTVERFVNAPIFDPITGFGGNGAWLPGNFSNPPKNVTVIAPEDVPDRTGGGCLQDGPFKDTVIHLGPSTNLRRTPRCIRRDFSPLTYHKLLNASQIPDGLAQPDFGWFAHKTESTVHSGAHRGIGGLLGDMVDKASSPTDPLFFLHHSNLDRYWWSWQRRDWPKRRTDISGPLVFKDFNNEKGGNATLETFLDVGALSKDLMQVKDVMDIGDLCYNYEALY